MKAPDAQHAPRVVTMTLRELAAMTREQVEALPDDERQIRRDRLRDDKSQVWGLRDIADMLDLAPRSVTRFRNRYLNNGGHEDNEALCAPDPEINSDRIKQPGDPNTARGESPRFWPATARRWGRAYERLDEDYFPRPGGRKPGPAPRQRDSDDATGPIVAPRSDVDMDGEADAAALQWAGREPIDKLRALTRRQFEVLAPAVQEKIRQRLAAGT